MADVLVELLTTLFQVSMNKGVLPGDWKRTNINTHLQKERKTSPIKLPTDTFDLGSQQSFDTHYLMSRRMTYGEQVKPFEDQHGLQKNNNCEK